MTSWSRRFWLWALGSHTIKPTPQIRFDVEPCRPRASSTLRESGVCAEEQRSAGVSFHHSAHVFVQKVFMVQSVRFCFVVRTVSPSVK